MREIKFKAKGIEDYDKDKWYYGYYVKLDKTTYCFKEDYEKNPNISEYKIIFDVTTDWGLPNQHKMVDININTLCEYTGLKDKKYMDIYENDIGYYSWNGNKVLMRIIFQDGEFLMSPIEKSDNKTWDIRISGYNKDFELIGNIYDKEVK